MNTAAETDREEQLCWLALHLTPGLGARKACQILDAFGTPQAVFRASVSELEGAGLPRPVAQSIASGCTFEDAASAQQRVMGLGVHLTPVTGSRYPRRLRSIYDPPPLLFARGRLELLETVMISVVGTRRPSTYGMAAADRLSRDMAAMGLTIVSGMAKGIDTSSHKAALEVGGSTVAVLGCGVDMVYPAENRKLADQIAEKGLLLSEFAIGTPAYPQNFPIRNRVVSGLSAGVLVVEGARYSGSAITARLAMEQGRELFAVPGNITSKMSWGPNLLIKQGAKLVQEAEDVFSELSVVDRRQLASTVSCDRKPLTQKTLDPCLDNAAARDVYKKLRVDHATHIDVILEYLPQYSSSELIAVLFELEMLGLIRQLAGKNYVKVW
jgi:DNA processing protein